MYVVIKTDKFDSKQSPSSKFADYFYFQFFSFKQGTYKQHWVVELEPARFFIHFHSQRVLPHKF